MSLAPIGIGTYSRINHLKQTIEALQNNTLAKESELYIFSDAPQKGDEEIVSKVREYINTVDGFKKVHIVERKTNGRVANNRGGFQYLLDTYGKAIFLEDDIVTAPGFLAFMNTALDFYENDNNVLSVTGFSPIHHSIDKGYYSCARFGMWGTGIWKDKYQLISYLPKYEDILKDGVTVNRLTKMGADVLKMIQADSQNKIDALDVKGMYTSAKNNMISIQPSQTLVKNIGLDGSGVHCGDIDMFEHLELSSKINFTFHKINTHENESIVSKNRALYKPKPLYLRVINKLIRLVAPCVRLVVASPNWDN